MERRKYLSSIVFKTHPERNLLTYIFINYGQFFRGLLGVLKNNNNLKMKKLNVIDYNSDSANYDFRYKGSYLHGELEQEIGYDIFCFDRNTDFKEGIHEVFIEETARVATFFLWTTTNNNFQIWRGFLVYNDDEEFEYCKRAFINRDFNI